MGFEMWIEEILRYTQFSRSCCSRFKKLYHRINFIAMQLFLNNNSIHVLWQMYSVINKGFVNKILRPDNLLWTSWTLCSLFSYIIHSNDDTSSSLMEMLWHCFFFALQEIVKYLILSPCYCHGFLFAFLYYPISLKTML